jgi:hypothetical protein
MAEKRSTKAGALGALGLIAIALFAGAGLMPPAAASGSACLTAPLTVNSPTPTFVAVPATLGFVIPMPPPTCTSGSFLAAPSGMCPSGFFGVTLGQFCGPMVGPFSRVVCTWQMSTTNTVPTSLYAGLDYDGNGNVWAPTEFVVGPIAQMPFGASIQNPTPNPARVIAYPTTINAASTTLTDTTQVWCG